MRLAERNGQRELRAARLARLRGGEEDPAARAPRGGDPVLKIYLPAAGPAAVPAPVPVPPPAEDELARLPGAGPGLTAALRRAGLVRLAARLGPIGRLVPAARWIAVARAAAPRTRCGAEGGRTPGGGAGRLKGGAGRGRGLAAPPQAAMFASWMAIASSMSVK